MHISSVRLRTTLKSQIEYFGAQESSYSLQQVKVGPSTKDMNELPDKIMSVVHTGIHSLTRFRRVRMAYEEKSSVEAQQTLVLLHTRVACDEHTFLG